ncbi:MAG: peptide chain release factor N(5)-glutamine methyltransferase [Acidobacteriota bacterium]
MSTLDETLGRARERLVAAGLVNVETEARRLLAHCLSASTSWTFAHGDEPMPEEAAARLDELLERRATREPLQHLLGEVEFWSRSLKVSPAALIPRPETEHLVETVLLGLGEKETPRLADIGTGSGCIGLALLSERPLARLVATDVSEEALALAGENLREAGFEDRVELRCGHLAEPLSDVPLFDVVAANLPYVPQRHLEGLQVEVRDHEPEVALIGGERGTELVEELIGTAPDVLVDDGLLVLEIGLGQHERVVEQLELAGYHSVEVVCDLAGIPRTIAARRQARDPSTETS